MTYVDCNYKRLCKCYPDYCGRCERENGNELNDFYEPRRKKKKKAKPKEGVK